MREHTCLYDSSVSAETVRNPSLLSLSLDNSGARMLRSILASRVIFHLREESQRKIMVSSTPFVEGNHNGHSDDSTAQTELSVIRFS